MANTITNPVWVKSKPHASAEKQVGDSDPNARTDVLNRVEKGIVAVVKRILNTIVDGATADFTDQTTVDAFTGLTVTRTLDRDVTQASVANTVVETTVYSYAVPANTIGTSRKLRLTIIGSCLNNTGGTANFTVRGKLGSTTFCAMTTNTIATATARRAVKVVMEVSGKNTATAQVGQGHMLVGAAAGVTGASVTTVDHQSLSVHTGMTESATGALTLVATVQHTTATANATFEAETAHLEVVG